MRGFLVSVALVFSLSSCDMAFESSLFGVVDSGITLDSSKLSTMTLSQIKSSLGPGFYKALRADTNSRNTLFANLGSQISTFPLKSADHREALRVALMLTINATIAIDVLNKGPTELLPILKTVTATPSEIQGVFQKLFGGPSVASSVVDECYQAFKTISGLLMMLNIDMTTGTSVTDASLVEFYGDANAGDIAQAGLIAVYFNAIDSANVGTSAQKALDFNSFYYSGTLSANYSGPPTIATNIAAVTGYLGGTETALDGNLNLQFFKQIRKKLPSF